jgi:hypothetical protein
MIIAARNEPSIEGSFMQFASNAISTPCARNAPGGVRSARPAVVLAALMLPALVLMFPEAASSSPRVLEEVARVALPDPEFEPGRVAVQGDDLVITGSKEEIDPETGSVLVQTAFLFERQANGTWAFVMRLGPERRDNVEETDWSEIAAAIDGDVLAIQPRQLFIFERTPAGWVNVEHDVRGFDSSDIEVSNGTIVVGDSGCTWNGAVVRKNSSGRWTQVATAQGGEQTVACDDEQRGGDVDVSGDALIVANERLEPTQFASPEARIYERAGDAWPEAARLGNFGDATRDVVRPVAIDGSSAYVGSSAVRGLRVYDRNAVGEWLQTTTLAPADAFTVGEELRVEAEGYVVVAYASDPYRQGSVAVFQRQSSGRFEQIARLVKSDATSSPVITDVEIDVGPERTTVVVGTAGAAYVYELDDTTQPGVVQDNFQDGNANGWTPSNVNAWTVLTSGRSRVYRQKSFDNESTSALTGAVWTDQSIEADVIPTAIQGTDRFVGVAVRRSNAANYYYVSLRSSNALQLRKKVNGTFVTLASAPLTFQLGRRYRLRVEAIGTLIRAFVNGALVLEAVDESHTQGRAALLTWRARADFDNVVVTPNPLITVFDTIVNENDWTKEFGVWNAIEDKFVQTSTSGKGRAITGISTDDMIVQARARATSALLAGGWFGVMARHIDDRNFYYLRLGDGRVSIRRFLNGSFVELAGVPFTVRSNVTYTLRLEAVGTTLRGYVNNQFFVEASDASHAAGRYGLATNLTAVQFSDMRVQQP